MSQRTRVLRVIALAMLPLLAFVTFLVWRDQGRSNGRIEQERQQLVRAAALATQAFIEGNLSTVRALAVAPVIADQPPEQDRTEALARVLAVNPDWQGLSLVDADGWNLSTASGARLRSVNIADRPYFQHVMATGEPVVSSAVIGRVSGLPTVVLAAPIHFASGERGALIVPLPTGHLAEVLRSRIASEGVQVVVVDADGHTFVDPDPERALALASLADRADTAAALAGETGTRVLRIDGVETLSAYAPVPGLGWAVIVTEPAAQAFAPARASLRLSLIILALAVGGVIWMGWHFGGRLSRAYEKMAQARHEADGARGDAERQREHALFLAELSHELAESLDYATTLERVTTLCVPKLGDWCAVDVLDGDHIDRIAIAHVDPAKAALARELADAYPPLTDTPQGPSRAIASGRPAPLTHVTEADLEAIARDDRHLVLLRALGLRSALAVPLRARGRTIGALTLVSGTDDDAYGPERSRLAMDVAARAALAVDNARLYGDLQHTLGTRDEFLASAAHDLRTPLTAIKGSAQLLRRQLSRRPDELPERLDDGLATIDTTATHMAQMVDSLLDLVRLHFGRALELTRAPADLVALARAVAAEEALTSTRHSIVVDGDDAVIGEWDVSRVHRVISNLLGNAIKYSPEGGAIRVGVRAAAGSDECPTPHALLTVADDGIGIPRADLGRVFERFRRGSNVVGRIAGTGLGLAGARQIVEQHGGTIMIDSDEGSGTRVTVTLPMAAPPTRARAADRPDTVPAGAASPVASAPPVTPAGERSA